MMINKSAFTKLADELDPSIAKEIMEAYINQVREFTSEILYADMITRGRIVHTLKGDSPLVGADELTELANELDKKYKENNELSEEDCQRLSDSCQATIDELTIVISDY